MLIISKFKDFYDSGSAYGIDKKKVFKREESEGKFKAFGIDRNEIISLRSMSYFGFRTRIQLKFIYFCGDIYTYFKVPDVEKESKKKRTDIDYYKEEFLSVYNREEMENIKDVIEYVRNDSERDIFYFGSDRFNIDDMSKTLIRAKKWAEDNILDDLTQYSRDNNVAYFEFIINHPYNDQDSVGVEVVNYPELKAINFGRVLSPLETFGKIEQYVFGYLNNDPEMVTISDKDKAVARGHDGKYSFKTPPAKKKNK